MAMVHLADVSFLQTMHFTLHLLNMLLVLPLPPVLLIPQTLLLVPQLRLRPPVLPMVAVSQSCQCTHQRSLRIGSLIVSSKLCTTASLFTL